MSPALSPPPPLSSSYVSMPRAPLRPPASCPRSTVGGTPTPPPPTTPSVSSPPPPDHRLPSSSTSPHPPSPPPTAGLIDALPSHRSSTAALERCHVGPFSSLCHPRSSPVRTLSSHLVRCNRSRSLVESPLGALHLGRLGRYAAGPGQQ
jgi:hypothetical protein